MDGGCAPVSAAGAQRMKPCRNPAVRHPGTVRVLVVEDDAELADAVAAGLRREEMAVDIAIDGSGGLDRALTNDYDVVVLDRDLPGMHGDDVCAELIRSEEHTSE